MNMANQNFQILVFSTLFPSTNGNTDGNRSSALKYKLGAIAATLFASSIGICLPIWGKKIPSLNPKSNFFFIIKAFTAGIILATGFIHILPDAFDSLTSPCIPINPWGNFPFTGFVAMVAAICTLMVDVYANSYYKKKYGNENFQATVGAGDRNNGESNLSGVLPLHTHAIHGHGHASMEGDTISTELRYRVISQVLEFGIIMHTRFIAIALGASGSLKTIRPLLVAFTFYLFFEGIGLGGCITQGKFNVRAIAIMSVFFSLTTPVGIAIGIGIANVYEQNSPIAIIVEGIFDSASAGILIYLALVDLLSADLTNPKMQSNSKLLLGANVSFLFGASCMCLLAKWA
ncbi:zinc transporter 8-like isoform X1 [Coffea arabica]|uniref:Zinc transporter 8-like isoform X1 n=1 Tax=Coffea arabica TaxID=13443 RepID=A0A6P6WT09_COFAR